MSIYLSIFFLFVSYPPSSLNGTQPKPATCSEVNVIWKCMSEIWGIHSPEKSRAQKLPFSTTSQLNGNFSGLCLRTKHDNIIRKVRWKIQGVSYVASKCPELWSTNGLKLDRSIYQSSINSAFYCIAGLRTQRSASKTQPNFAKWYTVNRANSLP